MLAKGQELGHYRIVRLLGKGGMGEVYLAQDQKLGRQVAIKVLPEELATDPERRQRFEREARAAAALRHPNIVTLHAIEELDGVLFLVMEHVEGRPLAESIPRGGLPLPRLLEIAAELADGVAAAHAAGITHRDLKPGNILIDQDGRSRILDFGLAKRASATEMGAELGAASLEPTEALTAEGKIVGTVAYMSPEQVEGRAVDARSDIFSLGVLFYEMATGERPFAGDTSMSVLTAILRDEPEPVTVRNHRLPRHLGRIVRRCLNKDPARRYQSALDLKNDLVELLEELASGELEGPVATPRQGSGARRLITASIVGVALAALGAWWLTSRRADESSVAAAPTERRVRRLTVQGNPGFVGLSPDARYVVYEGETAGGRSLRLQQVATGSDVELVPPAGWNVSFQALAFTPDGERVRYTQNVSGDPKDLWEIPALGGAPRKLLDGILVGPAYSPDGRQAVYVPGTDVMARWTTLEVADLETGSRRRIAELDEKDSRTDFVRLAWSGDGSALLVGLESPEGYGLVLLDPKGGELRPVGGQPLAGPQSHQRPFRGFGEFCWTPDPSRAIVSASTGSRLQLWRLDLETGAREAILPGDFNNYESCGASADGRLVAAVREETLSELWIVPLDRPSEARKLETTTGRTDGVEGAAWLDDEELIYVAYGGGDWNLFRVPAAGGRSVQLTTKGASHATASKDGRIAFMAGWQDEPLVGIYSIARDGTGLRRLTPTARLSTRPSISPDGKWLFHQYLTLTGVDLVRSSWEGGEPLPFFKGNAHLVTYSPDGTRLAFHARNPELGQWQTAIGPADFGPIERWLDLHSESHSPWDSNDSLLFSKTVDQVSNVFRLRLDDLSEEQLTFFTEGQIFGFDLSPDRTRLAIGRGERINDLLLIEEPVVSGGD